MLKRSFALLVVCFLISVTGWSQRQGRGSMPDTAEIVEKMASKLDLDPLQEYSFKSIVTKSIDQRRALFSAGLDKEEMRDSVKKINEEEMNALSEVLDEDQMSTFKEMKEQMRQRGRNRGKQRGREGN